MSISWLCGFSLSLLIVVGAAAAESVPHGTKPDTVPAEVAPFDVAGFRSARFDMTPDEVRKAILHDFPMVRGDGIRVEENPTERTQLMLAKVQDAIAQGGVAQLVYVLGHASHKLIQVNVVWSKESDPAMTAAVLVHNASLLANYFQRQGFKPESMMVNAPLASGDGIVVFRGADVRNRTVMLVLAGTVIEAAKPGPPSDTAVPSQKEFLPTSLRLSYIADPVNPDIFRLKPGQF